MSLMLRGLLVMATVGALTFPTTVPQSQKTANGSRKRIVQPVNPSAPKVGNFTPDQVEYYMTDDGVAYIRPGLKVKINSITIGADGKPVVDFNLTDNMDQPLDRLGKVTPGPISLSFILAWWNPDTRYYTAYTTNTVTTPASSPHPGVTATQASTDSGGTFKDLEVGHGTYTFKTVLPAGFDATKTHTLGVQATRNLTDIIGKSYYANVEKDFRPDGAAVTATWDKIREATACNNCHDPLAAHGGSRRDVKLCVLCHQPQTIDPDTGHSVAFREMIHKIHFGPNLPSVKAGTPYQIIGYRQAVHDYSDVTFPQDIRNCDNCHEGTVASNKPTQSEVYFTEPGMQACGSCHDDINWATGANHPGGPQTDDSACSSCHQPDSGSEWDASVKAAHTVPLKSKQLEGLHVAIVSVTDMTAGSKPTVVFKATNDDGSAVDMTKLASFSPKLGGNTTSYYKYFSESAVGKGTFDPATGTTTYTYTNAIPADAKGTWTISGDFYRNVNLKRNDGKADISVREAAFNPIKYVNIEGGEATPRRTSVAMSQCNQCHDDLRMHGDQRMNIEECVICHNPLEGDQSQRPADKMPQESISFQRMVHRIHTGEDLTQDYTIYGYHGSVNNFNEVTFPGDRRNCLKCHVSTAAYAPPVAKGASPVTTLRDYFSPQGPATAACLGCHDNQDAAAHAFLNTANFPGSTNPSEACGACHSLGKDWGVDKVHAR